MKIRNIFLPFILFALVGCAEKVPTTKLVQKDYPLKYAADQSHFKLSRVLDFTMDKRGNLYVLDIDQMQILKFDSSGQFIRAIVGSGNEFGHVYRPCSIVVLDSLLVLHNISSLEFFDLNGKYKKKIILPGRGDLSMNRHGTIVINRMTDSYQYGNCLEVYDVKKGPQTKFLKPRSRLTGNQDSDFAFTGLTDDNRIVYVPAFEDSIFLFDTKGNLLKANEMRNVHPAPKQVADSLVFRSEDMYVTDDQIYVLRPDYEKSTDEKVYVKFIDQYDFDLQLVRTFELPESITMTVPLELWTFVYHKFVVRNNRFLFMVSEPSEHLVEFE